MEQHLRYETLDSACVSVALNGTEEWSGKVTRLAPRLHSRLKHLMMARFKRVTGFDWDDIELKEV